MSDYPGVQYRPNLPSTSASISSLSMNFESTRVVVGYSSVNSYQGLVRVYDYNQTSNIWSQVGGDINGPGANSHFGKSIDMDWDGNRIVVGANAFSTVYVYDYIGSQWENYSNILTSPSGSGSDFGFAVSISKDVPDVIAVGAPLHNNVHVYKNIDSTWVNTYSNIGTDIPNIVPKYNDGTNYIVKPEYNRYGESVRLSAFGEYLVVGQPGTVFTYLTSANLVDYIGPDIDVGTAIIATGFSPNLTRQIGNARVFKTGSDWFTSDAVQVGSLLTGDIDNVLGDDVPNNPRTTPQTGWSFPGFGLTCDISTDGTRLIIGAPLYSIAGGDYSYYHGHIYTFEFENSDWVKRDVFLGDKQEKLGTSLKLDYSGTRLAICSSNSTFSKLNVSDWNGTNWFNTQPNIVINKTSSQVNEHVYISNGTFAIISSYQTVNSYDYLLTQSILGNTLVSGYLAADELYVGANNNNNTENGKYSKTKRISFGGTYLDNVYEATTIENRLYKAFTGGQGNEGRSEMYIAKTSTSGGVDLIRLKSNEIHLDAYSTYNDQENKYVNNPVFALNYEKNIGIDLPFNDNVSGPGAYFRGTIDARAKMDVNGDVYIRNKLNINQDGANELVGAVGHQPGIFFDTRDGNCVNGSIIYSNTFTGNTLANKTGSLVGNASYSISQRAIDISSGGYINVTNVNTDNQRVKLTYWFKLTQLPVSEIVLSRYGDLGTSRNVTLYITTSGFKLDLFTDISIIPYTFEVDKWYHIYLRFPGGGNDTTTISPLFLPNTSLRVNDVEQVITNEPSYNSFSFYVGSLDIGPRTGTLTAYVGMIMLWYFNDILRGNNNLSFTYDNGPPSEMLKVGGDAAVTGKLGVGTTNPTNALEVVGGSSFTGNVGVSDMILVGQRVGIGTEPTSAFEVMGDSSFTGNVGVSDTLLVNQHVGIGTTNPLSTLQVGDETFPSTGDASGSITVFGTGDRKSNGGRPGIYHRAAIGLGIWSDYAMSFQVNGGYGVLDAMRINQFGTVGIGTTSPSYGHLHVSGVGSDISYTYGFLNSVNPTGFATQTTNYTIWANSRIAASEFNAFSDVRIKKNIEDIIDSSALETLRLLQPKTYMYIDEKAKGTEKVYGFIAQEVREVLQYAVTVGKGDIPNILTNSNVFVVDDTCIELRLDTPITALLTNVSVLNITTSDDKRIQSNVQSMISDTVIRVEYSRELSNVTGAYIHGEQIQDFHHLNKDSIWTVATAALQEVDRQLQAEKVKVASLETQLASVLARLDALEATS